MKNLMFLVCSLFALNSFAGLPDMTKGKPGAAPEAKCQAKAETFVDAFEAALTEAEGFGQGDDPWNDVVVDSVVPEKDNNLSIIENFTVYVQHSNEDGEGWTQNYKVSMNNYNGSCYLKTFEYLGAEELDPGADEE